MSFYYHFPAVKGIQANNEYYIAMVPLQLLPRLFIQDDSGCILPEFRAQRKLNDVRIPEIKQYILNNRGNYVFSALSASIDGNFAFKALESTADLGILEVAMDSVFLIVDGQHRKAAIEAAIADDPSLSHETISIVFFKDTGLIHSQQMFTDLNKHAIKTSNSLSTLYDSRDSLAMSTKRVIHSIEFFKRFTDKEKDILGKNSSKLFTLNNIYKANQKIIRKKTLTVEDEQFILEFWTCVADNVVEWGELLRREITKKDLRENYIVTLAITLNAFGRLGSYFYENRDRDMQSILVGLRQIDWLRSNRENWEGRTIRIDGKVLNNEEAVALTCSKIKTCLKIELSKEEILKEKQLMRTK